MKSIQLIILLFTLFIIAACKPNADASKKDRPNDKKKSLAIPIAASKKLESPQQAQAKREAEDALFKKECSSAHIYLTQRHSIFPIYGGPKKYRVTGMKIKFDMFNAASLATFENLIFEVTFKSPSGSIVKRETYIIDETIAPSQSAFHTVETNISAQDYNAFTETELTIVGADCK